MPLGSENFDARFDTLFVPDGFRMHPYWLGPIRYSYQQNDSNPASNASFSAADRETSLNDFGPGVYPSRSGRVYNVFGRGIFSFGSGTVENHSWTTSFDFTSLNLGYLPAGTMISVIDVDGMSISESMNFSAVINGGGNQPWMDYFDDAESLPEPEHGSATYNPVTNSYLFNGPNNNSGADVSVYVN